MIFEIEIPSRGLNFAERRRRYDLMLGGMIYEMAFRRAWIFARIAWRVK